jgi:D-sedoheptulose 7-phosphate isomerase
MFRRCFAVKNKIDEIYQSNPSVEDFATHYAEYLTELLRDLDKKAIRKVVDCFLFARDNGRRIFFIGNGGSAATASHMANDLAVGTRSAQKPFRALSLGENMPMITSIANDFGYDEIFTKQLEVFLEPGDVVVAISASGNSPNLVKGIQLARARGNFCVGFLGFDGGQLKDLCDLNIHIKTGKGEYGPVEDIHMVLDHLISSYLVRVVRQEQSKANFHSRDSSTETSQ